MIIKGYFNESCKICRIEINHYKRINRTIDWVDVISNKNALKDTKLSPEELIRRLHVVKDNKLHKGLDAFLIVWEEIPRYRILSKFARLPITYHLGWLIYEFIALILYAKNKHILRKVYE